MRGFPFLYCLSYAGTYDMPLFDIFYFCYRLSWMGVSRNLVADSYKAFVAFSPFSFEEVFVGLTALIYALVNFIFLPWVYPSCDLNYYGPMF